MDTLFEDLRISARSSYWMGNTRGGIPGQTGCHMGNPRLRSVPLFVRIVSYILADATELLRCACVC
jgi:hypothetical protein